MDCIGGRISVHTRVIGIHNCFLLPTTLTAPHSVAAGHVVARDQLPRNNDMCVAYTCVR